MISMNELSKYIIILCGEFKDSYKPLSRAAFWKLYHKYNDSVEELIHSDEEVIKELLKRSGSIAFALDEMSKMGISVTTFLDEDFPQKLYRVLKDFCPPLFYKCGNSEINKFRFVGYVGSRNITGWDEKWAEERVIKNLNDKYAIVTGGAKGIDTVALNTCMKNSGYAVLFVPDNIITKVRDPFIRKNIMDNRILVYSHVLPFASKTRNSFVSSAMERNKFIYAMSTATVVVRSDKDKGGTWAGVTESIKHKWSYVYVWDNKDYDGNQALIQIGAVPLADDGKVLKRAECRNDFHEVNDNKQEGFKTKQLSFLDML